MISWKFLSLSALVPPQEIFRIQKCITKLRNKNNNNQIIFTIIKKKPPFIIIILRAPKCSVCLIGGSKLIGYDQDREKESKPQKIMSEKWTMLHWI